MVRIRVKRTIAAPPDRVFEWLAGPPTSGKASSRSPRAARKALRNNARRRSD